MFSFFKHTSKLPSFNELSLKSYSFNFSLDRLYMGVDNVRYDVHLSPDFCTAATNVIFHLTAKHSETEEFLGVDKAQWAEQRDAFKELYRLVMVDAINKAKLGDEIQIDFLAQTAVVKMLIEEIRGHFEILLGRYRSAIRKAELPGYRYPGEARTLKVRLSEILQNREPILRNVGSELFEYLGDVQKGDLNEMREANFGVESILPDDVLSNPILLTDNRYSDFFLVEEYDVLLGRRADDPDKYDEILLAIKRLLKKMDQNKGDLEKPAEIQLQADLSTEPLDKAAEDAYDAKLDGWITHVDNIDSLFNFFAAKNQYATLKREGGDSEQLQELKERAQQQEERLDFFYRYFGKAGLIKKIAASFEMRPVYRQYCPPLVPQQVLGFFTSYKTRRNVASRLRRQRRLSDRHYSLKPLRKTKRDLDRLSRISKKRYLVRFLNGFSRYHRDLNNYRILKEAMDHINLATEEKIINLSRANNTLHEFMLPHEQVLHEKPIINHVIVKADVRGSTDITHTMNERKLNPASYFSMNFFDPISEILAEYDAVKVFIEGDAIILSIFEREDTPAGWYSVARACGIAINMLIIIERYNVNSMKYKLPILELGIGIAYNDTPPTFLFDGPNRITISPAINLADRLSGCAKGVRKIMDSRSKAFNLYVFQTARDEDVAATADDVFIRYNVNGIELNAAGFEKLSKEINLKFMECIIPEVHNEPMYIYTGKFPTASGKYQRLVIREAQIPVVSLTPEELTVVRMTPRRYYEVCTHPKVYEYVKAVT